MHYMNTKNKTSKVSDRMGEVTLGDKAGHFLVGELEDIGNYAIITNATWWLNNIFEIESWLEESGIATRYKHEGMVLTFECKEDLAMFLLRWG